MKDCEWPEYDSEEETEIAYKSIFSGDSPIKEHKCGLLCGSHGCGRKERLLPQTMEKLISIIF